MNRMHQRRYAASLLSGRAVSRRSAPQATQNSCIFPFAAKSLRQPGCEQLSGGINSSWCEFVTLPTAPARRNSIDTYCALASRVLCGHPDYAPDRSRHALSVGHLPRRAVAARKSDAAHAVSAAAAGPAVWPAKPAPPGSPTCLAYPQPLRRVVGALLLVPFKVSIRAMRERNAGNHADKTSPRCSMGCRGWGESGGPYPSSS